ncbi:MAG: SAM-dependent methyltransferase [Candidatus Omnitrophota bacterium]
MKKLIAIGITLMFIFDSPGYCLRVPTGNISRLSEAINLIERSDIVIGDDFSYLNNAQQKRLIAQAKVASDPLDQRQFDDWMKRLKLLNNVNNRRANMLYSKLPGLSKAVTDLINFLQTPLETLRFTFNGESYEFKIRQISTNEPFQPDTGLTFKTSFADWDHNSRVCTIYVYDMSDILHQVLRQVIFPNLNIPNNHNQHYMLAFFAEGLLGGILVDDSRKVVIPRNYFRRLKELPEAKKQELRHNLFLIKERMRQCFSGETDNEKAWLRYGLDMASAVHGYIIAQELGHRNRYTLTNQEVYDEVVLNPLAQSYVERSFYSFKDFMNQMLHNEKWGYYGSGRVRFGSDKDFSTYPMILAPFFGHMFAEHAFKIWQSMRTSGILLPDDVFTVAEFGGGEGDLAYDFLAYVNEQVNLHSDGWEDFADQLRYTIYELSGDLRLRQQNKNIEFGSMFQSIAGDARGHLSAISADSLKGLIFSNELTDAFGVHKVVLTQTGKAEVAFTVPRATLEFIEELRHKNGSYAVLDIIDEQDRLAREEFGLIEPEVRYFTKKSFEVVMDFLSGLSEDDFKRLSGLLRFEETYIPANLVKEAADFINENIEEYSIGLAQTRQDLVVYINPDSNRFIEGVGSALKAGYVITVDYGDSTIGLTEAIRAGVPLFGMYGPNKDSWFPHVYPYSQISCMDMTADNDFTAMARAGERVRLRLRHFGPQGDLESDIPISLDVPIDQFRNREQFRSIREDIEDFRSGVDRFKVLVQEKEGSDNTAQPGYVFSSHKPQTLFIDQSVLSPEVRIRAETLKRALSADLNDVSNLVNIEESVRKNTGVENSL